MARKSVKKSPIASRTRSKSLVKVKKISPKKSPNKPKRVVKKSPNKPNKNNKSPNTPNKTNKLRRKSPNTKRNRILQQIKKIPHTEYFIDFNAEVEKSWLILKEMVLAHKKEPSVETVFSIQESLTGLKYMPSNLTTLCEEFVDDDPCEDLGEEVLSMIWIYENRHTTLHVEGKTYVCENVMAIGGQGVILSARCEETDMDCVVKMVAYDESDLKDELKKLAQFKGVKGIVQPLTPMITLTDSQGIKVHACVFPKYGPTLSHLLKYENFDFNAEFLEWMWKQVFDVLKQIHGRGFVHLDVHPANILLGAYCHKEKTYEPKLYIIDFGISEGGIKQDIEDMKVCSLEGTCSSLAPSSSEVLTTNLDERTIVGDIGVLKYSSPFISERPPFWKDDFISLLFTTIYLKEQHLPWAHLEDDDIVEVNRMKKAYLTNKEYFAILDWEHFFILE